MATEPVLRIEELRQEAKTRWLRKEEIRFILQNYEQSDITSSTPVKPSSGSLFLYKRSVTPSFRNDHHEWRKKKNGKAIAETHEELKIGGVKTLNCYYAHGELNPNLNRRTYWMLDLAHKDIVLVHYLEVEVVRPFSFRKTYLNTGQRDNSLQQSLNIFGSDSRAVRNNYQNPSDNLYLHASETTRFLTVQGGNVDSLPPATVHQRSNEISIWENILSPIPNNSEVNTLSWEMGVNWVNTLSNDCVLLDAQNQRISNPSITMAHQNLFSFQDVIPEWAFSSQQSKVIIRVYFHCLPSEYSWAAIFGDTEVPLKIIGEGILFCEAPPHAPGKVPLCITSGNRESCMKVGEFEYLPNPEASSSRKNLPQDDAAKRMESLLISFMHTLLGKHDTGEVQTEHVTNTRTDPSSILEGRNEESKDTGNISESDVKDRILEELLKDKFQSWFALKSHGKETADCTLSKQEMGHIHAISALGYEWALKPFLRLGVDINFRDDIGWTALHWAAHSGRENMVAALLAAGASPGAVSDPTTRDLLGKPPASAASTSGHRGIAGYLSENALTFHLSSLKIEETEDSKASAAVEAERAVKSMPDWTLQSNTSGADDITLRDSLAAVKNAALAAARIQSAFRAHSFRKRHQRIIASFDSSSSRHQRSSRGSSDKFQVAALCIQKKFRGWKERKKFSSLRQKVVKIQALRRGYQMGKRFKLLLLVRILDFVILRWCRKRPALRGLRAGDEPLDENEEDEILRSFRKKKVDAVLAEAVSSVQSMAESPEARQQYCRILESYSQAAKSKLREMGKLLQASVAFYMTMLSPWTFCEMLKR